MPLVKLPGFYEGEGCCEVAPERWAVVFIRLWAVRHRSLHGKRAALLHWEKTSPRCGFPQAAERWAHCVTMCTRETGSSWLGFVAVFLGEEVPGLSFSCLGLPLGSNGNGITYVLACWSLEFTKPQNSRGKELSVQWLCLSQASLLPPCLPLFLSSPGWGSKPDL